MCFAWIVLFVELLSRGDVMQTLRWLLLDVHRFLLTCLLGSLLFTFLSHLSGSGAITYVIVSLSLLLPAYISGLKLRILGVPLLPWDFVLLSEAADVAPGNLHVDLIGVLGLLVFAAGSTWPVMLLRRTRRAGWKERGAVSVLSLFLFSAMSISVAPRTLAAEWASDPTRNMRENGFLLSTLYNVKLLSTHGSKNLTEGAVQVMAQASTNLGDGTSQGRPNVILVLSETFWDPTSMNALSFSSDPMPNYHALREKYSSGQLLTPVFGGGTANVEFEILTGLTTRFLPGGSIPYDQYVNRPIDSLASILSRQGYSSTVISPWPNWFFRGNTVYRYLGFARFISQEFMPRVFSGPYIPDQEVANAIINETNRTPEPDFVLANTAENHQPYPKDKFQQNTITVTGVSGQAKEMLETFAQGCFNADKMLKQLVDHYAASNEPTVIVWFGDHLPTLGENYSTYREARYVTGEDDPDWLEKMYRVPLLVWNNYLPEGSESLNMSTFYLGTYILHLAGLNGTPFTQYLWNQSKQFPVIPPHYRWAQFNISEQDVEGYQALEDDILFGEQKAYGDLKDRIISPDFMLGYGPMLIDEATVQANDSKTGGVVSLRGQNLSPRGVIFLGGSALETKMADGNLVGTIPAEHFKPGTVQIDVRVIDTNQAVIARSNTTTLTLPGP